MFKYVIFALCLIAYVSAGYLGAYSAGPAYAAAPAIAAVPALSYQSLRVAAPAIAPLPIARAAIAAPALGYGYGARLGW